MNYLPRTIQPVIEEASKFFKIVMVSGMRQVGKSTLLKQLSSDKRTIISFDDINNLESCQTTNSSTPQTTRIRTQGLN